MTLTVTDLSVCTDCLLIIANDDDSGIVDPIGHRAAMRAISLVQPGHLVPGDEDLGFCTTRCDSCGQALHGDRYRAYLVPR